jgi:hypothetical protein
MRFAAASVALAFIASSAMAQPTNNTAASTKVKETTTSKEVHATNVPKATHHAAKKKHHAAHCGCPPTHMKSHHMKATKKTETSTTKS